jgi:hypothetical protein
MTDCRQAHPAGAQPPSDASQQLGLFGQWHMNERIEAGDRAERVSCEGQGRHVGANERRTRDQRAGALDLDNRQVDASDRVSPRKPSRYRDAAAASEVEHGRAGLDPSLQHLDPVRVNAVIGVVGPVSARDAVVSTPHDRLVLIQQP